MKLDRVHTTLNALSLANLKKLSQEFGLEPNGSRSWLITQLLIGPKQIGGSGDSEETSQEDMRHLGFLEPGILDRMIATPGFGFNELNKMVEAYKKYPKAQAKLNSYIKELLHTKGLVGRGGVLSVSWNHDGTKLVSGGHDGTKLVSGGHGELNIWDSNSGLLKLVIGKYGIYNSVAWNPKRNEIAAGGVESIIIWNSENGNLIKEFNVGFSTKRHIAWDPEGLLLAEAVNDSLSVWDVKAGDSVKVIDDGADIFVGGIKRARSVSTIRGVAWSADGRLATWMYEGTFLIFVDDETSLAIRAHDDGMHALAWSPDGKRIATGGYNNPIKIWDSKFKGVKGDERLLATLSNKMTDQSYYEFIERLKRRHPYSIKKELDTRDSTVLLLAWSPSNLLAATYNPDISIGIWNPDTQTLIKTLIGLGTIASIAWSPDGKRLASSHESYKIRIWDIEPTQLSHV